MTKKLVKTEFKSLGWLILTGLCITGLLFFSNEVFGATIFEDDFNSYTDGNLGGQGFWVDFGFQQDFQVQGDITYEGLKAIGCSGDCAVKKKGSETPRGSLSYVIKLPAFITEGSTLNFWFVDDNVDKFGFHITTALEENQNWFKLWIGTEETFDKKFAWFDDWLWVKVEWEYDTQKWRCGYKIGSEAIVWTDWLSGYLDRLWLGIDEFELSSTSGNDTRYFDTISENPTFFCRLGNCNFCEIYDTCIEADCEWFYSVFLQEYFCVEPAPQPELCGIFYECQYCENQFTCEEDKTGFCEWVDRGFGEKCYMVEPLSPDWEVPDLEDCSLLSGIEMYLCEIKNVLFGVFMPSQEKINQLYQTIGVFKDKFPFNYVESLKRFFADISESVDEEKTIPIKILGQESNVSFEFWEQETTIGGVSETFKNVLFDFSTLIILLGFFVWLIGSIRRFF